MQTTQTQNLPDLLCLSHLRWNFVWQRPQHLLSRFAKHQRVFFVEEPIGVDENEARMEITRHESGVTVCVPQIPHEQMRDNEKIQQTLLGELLQTQEIKDYFVWYYTPMALGFSQNLEPKAVVFDCMDELSAFKNAPQILKDRETELLKKADLVFTGGQSLYEAKKDKNPRVYAFPSSIDVAHFAKAQTITTEPDDQKEIAKPRLGFFGVVDERFDIELLREIAAMRSDWHFVIIGPVVKIDENTLPKAANIHYLGGKKYDELPEYIAGWDVALLLFAMNESTKFISPTKTPEYLAAGCAVVSTPIRDVARPYGDVGLVHIADTPEGFVQSCEAALNENAQERLKKVDEFLAGNSWDETWRKMSELISEAIENNEKSNKTETASNATTGV